MPAVDDSRLLGKLELFQDLTPEQLADLNGLLRSSAVQAGTHFITADQPGEVVYVLIEGTVKIYVTQADGREVILAFLGPGDTVGEMSLVDSSGRFANEQIQALCTLDVPGRVARQILAMADRYGRQQAGGEVRIPLRLTQSDLAELVGASRERVNQVIVDFKQLGYISVDPDHRIRVHDPQRLTRYCR